MIPERVAEMVRDWDQLPVPYRRLILRVTRLQQLRARAGTPNILIAVEKYLVRRSCDDVRDLDDVTPVNPHDLKP